MLVNSDQIDRKKMTKNGIYQIDLDQNDREPSSPDTIYRTIYI